MSTESPGVVSHSLIHPFQPANNKTPYEAGATVTMRRPRVRDLIEADRQMAAGGQAAGDAALIAQLLGLTFADIADMDAEDYRALEDKGIAAGFFGPQASETPSSA